MVNKIKKHLAFTILSWLGVSEKAARRITQPEPLVTTGEPFVIDLVHDDILERAAAGFKTYGTLLQPFNNRDALKDAYEEALDLAIYLRQALYERDRWKD